MAERIIFTLEWSEKEDSWVLFRGRARTDQVFYNFNKKDAIGSSRAHCRRLYGEGMMVQLKVRNKNGRWAFENTYGKDPRRSKG